MSDKNSKEWIVPAAIPFEDMKSSDLEETVYWLLNAMGAKDLEWRTGGTGHGAADGGRDLEATFYTPLADGEIDPQLWWVECKGRSGTVEAAAIKSAVLNAQARSDIDVIAVCTNTQFSNPTRDWIRDWQVGHPRPKVKLWDRSHLERFLSRHPDVVLRLYSEALSLEGRLQALESKFWNNLEFVSPSTLRAMWKARHDVKFTGMGLFAAIVNEFEHGSITQRPWGALLRGPDVLPILALGLANLGYLAIRANKAGVEQDPIFRTFAYLILVALEDYSSEAVAALVLGSLNRDHSKEMPDDVKEFLLMPVIHQLQSELQDVCSHKCERISLFDRMTLGEGTDEIVDYWLRLDPEGALEPPDSRQILRIEKKDGACVVGFEVDAEKSCPLFELKPSLETLTELLMVFKRVTAFRKNEDEEARFSKKPTGK
jgi:hypothetical protein